MIKYLLVLLIVLSCGCVDKAETPAPEITTVPPITVPSTTLPPRTTPPPPEEKTIIVPPKIVKEKIIDIPFYHQEYDWSCGQTSVQMVLAYYGIDKTQMEIAQDMGVVGYSELWQISNGLKKNGLNTHLLIGYTPAKGFEELNKYAGIYPIIIYTWSDPIKFKHYMVIKGTSENKLGKSYVILDPAYGNIDWEFSEEGLKQIWAGGQFKMVVVEGWT